MHVRRTTTAVVTGNRSKWGARKAVARHWPRADIACEKALAKLGLKRDHTRVSIQGFGNVGSVAATLMHQAGYRIVGVSTSTGASITRRDSTFPSSWTGSISSTSLFRIFRTAATACRTRKCFSAGRYRHSRSYRESDHQGDTCSGLQTRILCEGANGPSTAYADEELDRKGIFVIPDILANAGGVTGQLF